MKEYQRLLRLVLDEGKTRSDRTGTGTISVFGAQARFDLRESFPCLTTKKLHLRSIIHELLWFLKGDTNIKYLKDNKVTIWDEWADENGNLGPVYGEQWRKWKTSDGSTIDQMKELIENIKHNPNSRRHIISAWNPGELKKMALPPCHAFSQFYISNNKLSCQLYQRSCDMFLGVPFNIASYSLLIHILAKECGYKVGEFILSLGDFHIYEEHFDQVKIQLSREPKKHPSLQFKQKKIYEYKTSDFELINYEHHPKIMAQMNV